MTMPTTATAPATGVSQRIAFIGPSARSLHAMRGALISDLIARRHRVLCLAPATAPDDVAGLTALGAEMRDWPQAASFLRLIADHKEVAALRAVLADWQPHAVMAYGDGRALAAGLAAAKAARVPRVVALINGLPPPSEHAGLRALRPALAGIPVLVAHNRDDVRALQRAGALASGTETVVVPGSGVDLSMHAAQPLPGLADGLVFTMIASLDRQHGIGDFLAAAAVLKQQAPSARFLLAGPIPSGDNATARLITERAGIVDYLGVVADVRPLLARTHVFVYPGHGEGMPRAVVEALAAGRPIVTTDAPGCRDTVDERVNGCLVPPANPQALAEAMASFLRRPDLIASAARASRMKAERGFDVHAINSRLRSVLGVA